MPQLERQERPERVAVVDVVAAFVLIYRFDPVRADTLTLSIPAVGQMTPASGTTASSVEQGSVSTSNVALSITSTVSQTNEQVDLALSEQGQPLYVANCSACHGVEAQGVPSLGTSLIESPMIQEQSEVDALAFIRAGRDANDPANTTGIDMPPSGGNPSLTDEEILAIVAFLRTR